MNRTNPVRDAVICELLFKEKRMNATLRATERLLMCAENSDEEKALDEKAQRLAGYLTHLDEVLRLLEAR